MASFAEVKTLVNQFEATIQSGDCNAAKTQLVQLKLALIPFHFLSPSSLEGPDRAQHFHAARTVLELAALLSLKMEDVDSFNRHVAQVKTYYFSESKFKDAPPSPRKYLILGLNLLRLLAHQQFSEFHTELQLISIENLDKPEILHSLKLERSMVEGNYIQVFNAQHQVPEPSFTYFMNILMDTTRNEIASCLEVAYKTLALSAAQQMLSIESTDEFSAFVSSRAHWKVCGDHIEFVPKVVKSAAVVPSMLTITQNLHYAKELERIV
eukprot:CAMPEP_0177655752 /NCGR_PEP_ID=MMETSP0447-20121125/15155_1 /TAXON_ID=0 /ORGANISM="Stygamoeba regulata, Strain BSH-02190019" /LENGTH=266 /DNA_ID=CAMNT_0019159733 /DNA_START=62 /DNA_END=862 /DNA_ORIENTATION=-